jgi:hypothetical protein
MLVTNYRLEFVDGVIFVSATNTLKGVEIIILFVH